jgi:hypothetical protein
MLALSDELEKKYLERYVGRNMEVLYVAGDAWTLRDILKD